MIDPLEQFWNEILSRHPDKVRAAYADLDIKAKQAVLTHLESMASESGWHPEQVRSAQAALAALRTEDGFVEGIDVHE